MKMVSEQEAITRRPSSQRSRKISDVTEQAKQLSGVLKDVRLSDSETQAFGAFQKLYGEWLWVRGKTNMPDDLTDEEMESLGDKESELAQAIWATPALCAHYVFVKLELLDHYFDKSDWSDQRDLRLIASIKADLRELLP
jgi:hypothetical protein